MLVFKKNIIVIVVALSIMGCTDQEKFNKEDLFTAVEQGEIVQIDKILSTDININSTDSFGNSILMIAVGNKDKGLVQHLLSKKADPNLLNKDNISPLDISRKNQTTEITSLIQKFQYHDWLKEEARFTEEAYEFAVDNDNVEIVSDFIKNGRDPNLACISKGLAPLIHAIFTDSYEVIYFLLDNEANPDVTFDTRPAIATAAMFNQYEVVKKLIDKGAEIDFADGPFLTALMLASEEGNQEIVELLLENGADKNLKDMTGETATDKAAKNNHAKIVALLSI